MIKKDLSLNLSVKSHLTGINKMSYIFSRIEKI